MRSLLSFPFVISFVFAAMAAYLIHEIFKPSSSTVYAELAPAASPVVLLIDGFEVPDVGVMPERPQISGTNRDDRAQVELGKQLFFDGRLSKNNKISCSYCHIPGAGFADPHPTSAGVDDLLGSRQAPTILNAAFNRFQFWDGRASSLEEQATVPIQNPIEMAETPEQLVTKLEKLTGYQRQFLEVFGADVSFQRIVQAIAAFERTIISRNSSFDRYVTGQTSAMDESAIRGLRFFKGKARCILCHNGPNFTDNQFHNLGVPQIGPLKEDLGRYAVTKQESDKGAFKTPTLRSVLETAPYMHDGAFLTLEEVIEFLDQGGGPNPYLSPLMKPLGLTDEEKKDLVSFLETLTGEPLRIEAPSLP